MTMVILPWSRTRCKGDFFWPLFGKRWRFGLVGARAKERQNQDKNPEQQPIDHKRLQCPRLQIADEKRDDKIARYARDQNANQKRGKWEFKSTRLVHLDEFRKLACHRSGNHGSRE